MGTSVYEYRMSKIFVNYLKGWLIIDLGAMGPSVIEVYFALGPSAASDAAGINGTAVGDNSASIGVGAARAAKTAKAIKFTRAARFLKLARLFKLVKLVRAIKMINDPDGIFQWLVDKVTVAMVAHARKLSIFRLILIFGIITIFTVVIIIGFYFF